MRGKLRKSNDRDIVYIDSRDNKIYYKIECNNKVVDRDKYATINIRNIDECNIYTITGNKSLKNSIILSKGEVADRIHNIYTKNMAQGKIYRTGNNKLFKPGYKYQMILSGRSYTLYATKLSNNRGKALMLYEDNTSAQIGLGNINQKNNKLEYDMYALDKASMELLIIAVTLYDFYEEEIFKYKEDFETRGKLNISKSLRFNDYEEYFNPSFIDYC